MAVTQPNLTIGLTVNSGCSELNLTDDTGEYGPTNVFGYGAPGAPTSDEVTGCEVVVTYSTLGTYLTFDFTIASGVITAATLAVGSATPTDILSELDSTAWPFIVDVNPLNLVGEYGVTIPEFTDEIFKVEYNITGEITGPESFDFTTTVYEPVICNSRCCVDRRFAEIDVNCECSDDKVKEALYGESLLKQVEIASEQGNLTAALQALEQLRVLCGTDGGCGC